MMVENAFNIPTCPDCGDPLEVAYIYGSILVYMAHLCEAVDCGVQSRFSALVPHANESNPIDPAQARRFIQGRVNHDH